MFKIFSRNFEYVDTHNGEVRFVPTVRDIYLCPICFEGFKEQDLEATSKTYLTLEHVPPDSLGGKGALLTCSKCNSESGKLLDKQLLTYLEGLDFADFLPNTKQNRPMTFNGNKINARIRVDGNGTVNLHLDPTRSNPVIFQNVIKEFKKAEDSLHEYVISGSMPLPETDSRLVEIALLRIGYLAIFSTFGYCSLLNQGMYYVKEQISKPTEKIIEHPYSIVLPSFEPGIYILKTPKELNCFVVIFDLKTKSTSRRFSVMLPGPSAPGVKIYSNFKTLFGEISNSNIPFELEHLPVKKYVSDIKLAFGYHFFWQKFSTSKSNNENDERIL
ncbi:hypothetical protein GCM10022210_28750 [Mucilaginibacter dorajii]|uniref:HNH endonuclease 5 domain-containing protein n=1 Tax=Mucilaginibacter dorajii TaxID=692994 RepID=A0ABP7Q490_9SPHI